LNIERARLDRALSSEQIKNLVIAFGTAIGDTFDITNLRYHKIIIMSDADDDGHHIFHIVTDFLLQIYETIGSRWFLVPSTTSFVLSRSRKEKIVLFSVKQN